MNPSFGITELKKEIAYFKNKYYLNDLLKGSILMASCLIGTFLFFTYIEYMGEFSSAFRLMFLISFVLLNSFFLVKWVLIPLAKKYQWIKGMDDVEASKLIGLLFPDIKDRLLNTLQLHESLDANHQNIDLLSASIRQKTDQMRVFTFSNAIDLKVNKKYTRYLIPGVLVLAALLLFIPHILTQSTFRIINFDSTFAPFTFYLEDTKSAVEEGSDLPVRVVIKGRTIPEKVYIVSDQGKFLMKRDQKNEFSYVLKKPSASGSFLFEANENQSKTYPYVVNGKSALSKLSAKLKYPKYLNKPDASLSQVGDLTVPEGTTIEWSARSKNTKKVELIIGKLNRTLTDEFFTFQTKHKEPLKVNFRMFNRFSGKIDTLNNSVSVVKDAYPVIQVNEQGDSVNSGIRYFNGEVSDDYGLRSLTFHYELIRQGKTIKERSVSVMPVSGSKIAFNYAVDFRREEVQLDDKIVYYFLIKDNDGVNGSKGTKSYLGQYQLPSLEELVDQRDEQQAETRKDLEKLLDRTQKFQKDIEKLKKDVSNSKSIDYNKKQQLNQLQEEQKSMEDALKSLKEEMNRESQEKDQLSKMDQSIMEKQEMIEKLLEQVMDEELKKLLDDLKKLFDKNESEEIKPKMDKLNQNASDMNKQLDRSLEMLKKLQVNEKIDDLEKALKNAAEEERKLKEDAENKKIDTESAAKKQEELNKKFEDIQKKLEETKKLNESLESPINLDNTEELQKEIKEAMSEAGEQLKKGKSGKAGSSQKSAAEKMDELAEQLNQQQEESNKEQEEEDMALLRQILESLMILSFEQESLIPKFNQTSSTSPAYKKLGRAQIKLHGDTKIVKDSLLALAKRQPKVATFIDKELNLIESAQNNVVDAIDDHEKASIVMNEQLIMTSYNNLALLLNEALQQMQSQMQQQGTGSCSKPGKGKPKSGNSPASGDMKQMLKKQLEQMQKGMSPGSGKPGEKPGDTPGNKPGEQGMGMMGLGNQEIAKMAAEQTAIRQRLEQLRNEMNKDGKGSGNALNPLIKELEQQEKDLINKRFGGDMINRQKNILTRLLESEKANMERGFEEKRESKSADDKYSGNLIELKEYNEVKMKQIELLRAVDPAFNNYYKQKAAQYFNVSN